jgi:hypothetical protein
MKDESEGKKTRKVKIIKRIGKDASLVEWEEKGLPHRATVPGQSERVDVSDLEAGVPYGVRWEDVDTKLDKKALATKLYANDIWTLEDAKKNPQAVIGICMEVTGMNLSALIRFAKAKEKPVNETEANNGK